MKAAAKPARDMKAQLAGTPGELCELPDGLDFSKGGRQSPYDSLLKQLAEATQKWFKDGQQEARPGLKFNSPAARASIYARAKKKSMRVQLAEHSGFLYVMMDTADLAEEEKKLAGRKGRVYNALMSGPKSSSEIVNFLKKDDPALTEDLVLGLLGNLQRDGDVIKQDGDRWIRNPRPKPR